MGADITKNVKVFWEESFNLRSRDTEKLSFNTEIIKMIPGLGCGAQHYALLIPKD